MYKTIDYIKAYYIYDRTKGQTTKFTTKNDMFDYIIIMMHKFNLFTQTISKNQLTEIEQNQNFTGTDKTINYSLHSHDTHFYYEVHEFLNAFTFYYESFDSKLHIFDIRIYEDEILNHTRTRKPYKYNRYTYAYQVINHHRKMDKYELTPGDEYEEEYYQHATHRKKGCDNQRKYDCWGKYSKKKERSWKRQTHQKHQYHEKTKEGA